MKLTFDNGQNFNDNNKIGNKYDIIISRYNKII